MISFEYELFELIFGAAFGGRCGGATAPKRGTKKTHPLNVDPMPFGYASGTRLELMHIDIHVGSYL
jgi:hypothetical protein